MKKITWDNGNKMHFESGHKTFDRQCVCISTGNQLSDTVVSTYIRAYTETECNGGKWPEGHLQNYDFDWMFKDMPRYIQDQIKKMAVDNSVIAYQFFYYSRGERINIGYVVTSTNHDLLRIFRSSSTTYKADLALDEAIKYISNSDDDQQNFQDYDFPF